MLCLDSTILPYGLAGCEPLLEYAWVPLIRRWLALGLESGILPLKRGSASRAKASTG